MFLCEEKGAMSYAEATMRKSKGSAKNKAHPGAGRAEAAPKNLPARTEFRRAVSWRPRVRFTNEWGGTRPAPRLPRPWGCL